MEGLKFLIVFAVLALASSFASASDPSPLQDFCVAMNETDGGMCFLSVSSRVFVRSYMIILHWKYHASRIYFNIFILY